MAQPEPALGTRIGACRRSEQVCHHDRMEAMETQQESRGRLARPLIRLVCAYVWRRHALARTATTSRSTTAPGMRARPSKRRCRKPSRARVAGRCPRSRCRGIPSVSVTSENGAEYIGHISLGQGSGASAHPCGGGYYVASPVIILADMPMGYRALRVSVSGTRIAWRLSLSAAAGPGARSAVGWVAQL